MASRVAFLCSLALIAGCAPSAMSPAPGTVNGCANGDFGTAAADGGTARVQYGDPIGLAYSPKCLSVAAGQSVTFFGDPTQGSDFTVHPLRPGGYGPGTEVAGAYVVENSECPAWPENSTPAARPACGAIVDGR